MRVFIPPCKPASSQDGTGGGHVGSVSARIRAAGRAAQLPPQGEEDREPPFTWAPHIVYAPAAWQLPDAEPVPPEALQPGAGAVAVGWQRLPPPHARQGCCKLSRRHVWEAGMRLTPQLKKMRDTAARHWSACAV